MILPVVIALISILIGFSGIFIYNRPSASCDMKIATNRNFNKYYGIIDMKNHFTTPSADDCSANIIFQPALPQMILNPDHSASSFMTLAQYGTGKTALRCEYVRSLSWKNYLKVSILNQQITEYLDRFVSKMGLTKMYCETNNCLINWSENEFAQLLLSTLVTEFINTYDNLKHNGPDISLDEKVNLITIVCYYYNGLGTVQLEKFVNSFLSKSLLTRYHAEGENVEQYKYYNQQLFTHLKDDLSHFLF